jgi:hypothetical protein
MVDVSKGEAAVQGPGARRARGFPPAQQALAAAAAVVAPFLSTILASVLLRTETDPERRRQLALYRRASLAWFLIGLGFSLVLFVVSLAVWVRN